MYLLEEDNTILGNFVFLENAIFVSDAKDDIINTSSCFQESLGISGLGILYQIQQQKIVNDRGSNQNL